jgi:lipoate-protein ligase A
MDVEVSEPATGAENMGRDVAMANAVRSGQAQAMMRLYTWQPWAVSLGRNQAEEHIDHDALRRRGYGLVRRPTGGRAVLHANELTYCIATHRQCVESASQFYADVHERLRRALTSIVGTALVYQDVPTDLRRHYASSGPMGAACFSSSATSEIMWNGRKVVGSAQHVDADVILQHGSILCGMGHEQLADVLLLPDANRGAIRSGIIDGAATLSDVAGRPIAPADIVECIVACFA